MAGADTFAFKHTVLIHTYSSIEYAHMAEITQSYIIMCEFKFIYTTRDRMNSHSYVQYAFIGTIGEGLMSNMQCTQVVEDTVSYI